MATLPTPPTTALTEDQDDIKYGLPIVVMHESTGPILDALLRIIYPDDKTPILEDVDIAMGVAFTAMKYEMTRVMEIAEQELLRAPMLGRGTMALRLCMEARRRGLKKIAHHFAVETLKCPLSDIVFTSEGLEETSALDLWQYFVFRKRVEEEVSKLFQDRLDDRSSGDFYGDVKKVYLCSSDCGNGPSMNMSMAWTNWRACILENVHSAPLAIEVLSDPGLYRAKERTRPKCDNCTSEIAEDIHKIVEAFKAEIQRIVSEVSQNITAKCSPSVQSNTF